MKKIIFFCIFICLLYSQINYTFKIGLNQPYYTPKTRTFKDFPQKNLVIGFAINLNFLAVQTDLELNFVGLPILFEEKRYVNFLDLPLTVRVKLSPLFFLRGGIQYDYVSSATNDKGNYASYEYNSGLSIILGSGIHVDFLLSTIMIDLRYIISTYDLLKDISGQKMNRLQATIGIQL